VQPACVFGATSGLITVTTSDGSATSTTSLTVLNNPPVITSFSPTSAPVGSTVTINGANFTGATIVRFRTTATSFSVLYEPQIQAVVPAGARSGAIVVITPNGFNTSPTKFTIFPPDWVSAMLLLVFLLAGSWQSQRSTPSRL
jgi:large repetitive protein